MKILVTGGAGFIGSNLIENLVKNHDVTSLDCYSSGTEKNHIKGVKYIKGYTWEINKIFNKNDFEVIYHFGEYSRIVSSFNDIDFVSKSILHGTPEVLNFCIRGKSKLIYSASSSKFGNDGKDENLSPYSFMKSKMVELIKNYNSWFDLKYEIAYFFNVYGQRQIYNGKYATVVAIFERQYLNDQPLTVVSPGTQSRDFTHVNDIVNGLKLLLNVYRNKEWYLRSGKNIKIKNLAKMFSSNIIIIPERRGERFTSEEFENDTNKELKFKPKENLKDWVNFIKSKKL